MGKVNYIFSTPNKNLDNIMQIDDQIKKRAEKNKKNKKKEVNIFGDNQEKNENNNENAVQNDEEESDFIIQGKIVDANVNNNNMNTNVNDQTWKEDTNVVQYNVDEDAKPKEEKKKVSVGWGDNIKSTTITSKRVEAGDLYFPDLNDKNAEKNAPKKEKNSSLKNPDLFGTGQSNNTGGGNWTNPKSDKFKENDNAIRFTNAKGNTEKLNKFMVKEGPTYDDTLGDNVEKQADL